MTKKRKKKGSAFRAYLLVVAMLAAALVIAYYGSWFLNRPHFVRYPAFGIDIPVNYQIHGIDVSRYQSTINWKEVSSMQVKNVKIGFSFIKATEGIGSIDERFRRNWYEAKKAGLPRGAYHFFNPGKSGKAQARNFIETVDLEKNDLPPVLDIEQVNGIGKADLRRRVQEWLDMVEAKYKVKPIIYTNADFYQQVLAGAFEEYPLWVAHYYAKERPRVSRNWLFWQHNETGRVNGISTAVDFNVFSGDSAAFRKILMP